MGNIKRGRYFTSTSSVVSKIFGVSPKTVRDIWNMRTWRHCTQARWTDDDLTNHADFAKSLIKDAAHATSHHTAASETPNKLRRVGRPRGAKDSQPRRRKQQFLNATKHSENQAFPNDYFHRGASCDGGSVDSDISNLSTTCDTFEGANLTMPWNEDHWARYAMPASSPGFELNDGDDLSRSFPFFLQF